MRIVKQRECRTASGRIWLRIYDRRGYLAVVPDSSGQGMMLREYDYYESDRATSDFEALCAVLAPAGVEEEQD